MRESCLYEIHFYVSKGILYQFDLDVKCLLMSPWLRRLGDYSLTMTLNLRQVQHMLIPPPPQHFTRNT